MGTRGTASRARSRRAPIPRGSSKASGCRVTWGRGASRSSDSSWSEWTPSATCCSSVARCRGPATGWSPSASREAGAAMIEAPHFSAAGAKKKALALPAALFDGTVNEAALHRAVVTYLANQRQGTHQTKTRSFVSGGNQKPWRPKGTGPAPQAHSVYLSGRNLPGVRVMRFADATAYEILWAAAVVIETTALEGAAAEGGTGPEGEAAAESAGEGAQGDA